MFRSKQFLRTLDITSYDAYRGNTNPLITFMTYQDRMVRSFFQYRITWFLGRKKHYGIVY